MADLNPRQIPAGCSNDAEERIAASRKNLEKQIRETLKCGLEVTTRAVEKASFEREKGSEEAESRLRSLQQLETYLVA